MFEDAHPLEILRWAGEEFGDGLVVTASFGDAVLVHLVSQAIPDADVVLLDTGYLFAETAWYAEHLRQAYGLNLRIVAPRAERRARTCGRPTPTAAARRARSSRCSGRSPARRRGSAACAGPTPEPGPTTPIVHVDLLRDITKINPIATWTDEDVAHYKAMELLPEHPLTRTGYAVDRLLAVHPPVAPGEDARAGRWAGRGKTECGLHVADAGPAIRSASSS